MYVMKIVVIDVVGVTLEIESISNVRIHYNASVQVMIPQVIFPG